MTFSCLVALRATDASGCAGKNLETLCADGFTAGLAAPVLIASEFVEYAINFYQFAGGERSRHFECIIAFG